MKPGSTLTILNLQRHSPMSSIRFIPAKANHDASDAVKLGMTWNSSLSGLDKTIDACDRFFGVVTLPNNLIVGFVDVRKPAENQSSMAIDTIEIDEAMDQAGTTITLLEKTVQKVSETFSQVELLTVVTGASSMAIYLACGFSVRGVASSFSVKGEDLELVYDVEATRRIPIVKVDAFTSKIFSGNPAAVVTMKHEVYSKEGASEWMQNIARETNLAQTAFLSRRQGPCNDASGRDHYNLRWFSPTIEVPLCGHATLSSAFMLYNDGHVSRSSKIHFHTLSGVLTCSLEEVGGRMWIAMDFPLREVVPPSPNLPLELIASSLNLAITDFVDVRETKTGYVLLHVPTGKFQEIIPNFALLMQVDACGIVVTSQAYPNADGVDFQSRFFAPRVGVPEDPVTGSAHCALAGYWASILDKTTLHAHQACPSRGGYLRLELPRDRKDRVIIKGEAVVTMRGTVAMVP